MNKFLVVIAALFTILFGSFAMAMESLDQVVIVGSVEPTSFMMCGAQRYSLASEGIVNLPALVSVRQEVARNPAVVTLQINGRAYEIRRKSGPEGMGLLEFSSLKNGQMVPVYRNFIPQQFSLVQRIADHFALVFDTRSNLAYIVPGQSRQDIDRNTNLPISVAVRSVFSTSEQARDYIQRHASSHMGYRLNEQQTLEAPYVVYSDSAFGGDISVLLMSEDTRSNLSFSLPRVCVETTAQTDMEKRTLLLDALRLKIHPEAHLSESGVIRLAARAEARLARMNFIRGQQLLDDALERSEYKDYIWVRLNELLSGIDGLAREGGSLSIETSTPNHPRVSITSEVLQVLSSSPVCTKLLEARDTALRA